MESLSSYARQFLGQMEKPDVDYIEGLSPAISIDQKTTSKNPRSTVGTVTEIYDYLRLLYARIGIPIARYAAGRSASKRLIRLWIESWSCGADKAPDPGARRAGAQRGARQGIRRGAPVRIRARPGRWDHLRPFRAGQAGKNRKHTIEIIVDRLVLKEGVRNRLADSIETASGLSGGLVVVSAEGMEDIAFSQNYACPEHGVSVEELTPRMFSFNNPFGACSNVRGSVSFMKIDPERIPAGSPAFHQSRRAEGKRLGDGGEQYRVHVPERPGLPLRVFLDTPIADLPDAVVDILLYGTKERRLSCCGNASGGHSRYTAEFEGLSIILSAGSGTRRAPGSRKRLKRI